MRRTSQIAAAAFWACLLLTGAALDTGPWAAVFWYAVGTAWSAAAWYVSRPRT